MLVVERNENFIQWNPSMKVSPMKYSGEVIVVFDPSKSNMAMVIGTPTGDILNTIEFSGNNRKRGPVMDTTVYCQEVRQFLSVYLSKVKLYMVGIEQAITKQGTSYHHSNMVLTEIRSNILNFFLEEFGVKVIEINNWSWKHAILPEGYRSPFEKGSKKYFVNTMPESPFSRYFEADMTDCICMYWYLIKNKCTGYTVYCNKVENCDTEYKYAYSGFSSTILTDSLREVQFNPRFTIKENLDYYCNRILGKFFMLVEADKVDVSDVYGKSVNFCESDLNADKVRVVVIKRC